MNEYGEKHVLTIGDKAVLLSCFISIILVLSVVAFWALNFLFVVSSHSDITFDEIQACFSQYKIEIFILSIIIASLITILCIIGIIKLLFSILQELVSARKLKIVYSFLSTISNFNSNKLFLDESSSRSPITDLICLRKGHFKAIAFDEKQKVFCLIKDSEYKLITIKDIISFEIVDSGKRNGKHSNLFIHIVINDINNPVFTLCMTDKAISNESDTYMYMMQKGLYWKSLVSVLQQAKV
jgi:hypothetical protein